MAKDLPSFIRSLGVNKAAELWDETPRAVRGWLYGERRPKPRTAQKMIARSGGKLSLASIYAERERPQ